MIYPHHLVDAGMAVCYKNIQINETPLQQTQLVLQALPLHVYTPLHFITLEHTPFHFITLEHKHRIQGFVQSD